jgi:hypothetical protein
MTVLVYAYRFMDKHGKINVPLITIVKYAYKEMSAEPNLLV